MSHRSSGRSGMDNTERTRMRRARDKRQKLIAGVFVGVLVIVAATVVIIMAGGNDKPRNPKKDEVARTDNKKDGDAKDSNSGKKDGAKSNSDKKDADQSNDSNPRKGNSAKSNLKNGTTPNTSDKKTSDKNTSKPIPITPVESSAWGSDSDFRYFASVVFKALTDTPCELQGDGKTVKKKVKVSTTRPVELKDENGVPTGQIPVQITVDVDNENGVEFTQFKATLRFIFNGGRWKVLPHKLDGNRGSVTYNGMRSWVKQAVAAAEVDRFGRVTKADLTKLTITGKAEWANDSVLGDDAKPDLLVYIDISGEEAQGVVGWGFFDVQPAADESGTVLKRLPWRAPGSAFSATMKPRSVRYVPNTKQGDVRLEFRYAHPESSISSIKFFSGKFRWWTTDRTLSFGPIIIDRFGGGARSEVKDQTTGKNVGLTSEGLRLFLDDPPPFIAFNITGDTKAVTKIQFKQSDDKFIAVKASRINTFKDRTEHNYVFNAEPSGAFRAVVTIGNGPSAKTVEIKNIRGQQGKIIRNDDLRRAGIQMQVINPSRPVMSEVTGNPWAVSTLALRDVSGKTIKPRFQISRVKKIWLFDEMVPAGTSLFVSFHKNTRQQEVPFVIETIDVPTYTGN